MPTPSDVVACPNCEHRYKTEFASGSKVICSKCRHIFFIPFADEDEAVQWANLIELPKLWSFLRRGATQAFSEETRVAIERIYEFRRWVQNDSAKNKAKTQRRVAKKRVHKTKALGQIEHLLRESSAELLKVKNMLNELHERITDFARQQVQYTPNQEQELNKLQMEIDYVDNQLCEISDSLMVVQGLIQPRAKSTSEGNDHIRILERNLGDLHTEAKRQKKELVEASGLLNSKQSQMKMERRKEAEQKARILLEERSQRVISWAKTASWQDFDEFMLHGKASGLPIAKIDELVQLHTNRRWHEEDLIRKEIRRRDRQLRKESTARIVDEKMKAIHQELVSFSVNDVIHMDPSRFELFVANLFEAFGYDCEVVGGPLDEGVDVKVWIGDSLYAIAQCKRYLDTNISSSQIREFIGTFAATEAKKAFFFTTSDYTRSALNTAKNFGGVLELYNLDRINKFVRNAQARLERRSRLKNTKASS